MEKVVINNEILETNLTEKELFEFSTLEAKKSEIIKTEPYSYWKSVLRAFIRKPSAIIGLILFIILILGIIIIPLITPVGATKINNYAPNLRPGKHGDNFLLLGTDLVGRDLFYSVWQAAGKSVLISLITSTIVVVIGTILGMIWGYYRKLDRVFIEIYNLVSNIPSLLLFILLATVLRQSVPSLNSEGRLIISLTVLGWVGLSLFIRNQVLIISNREYNIASKTLGTPAHRIISRNYFPYILSVIITQTSLIIPGMISSEVSLSYFGVGIQSDKLSIGVMLNHGISRLETNPEQMLVPAAMLAFIILIFFTLGIALSDALNPKNHR